METGGAGWNLDRLPIGIWVARAPDGVCVYSNQAFDAILGMGSTDVEIGAAPATYGIFDRNEQPYPVDLLPFSRVLATGDAVEVNDLVIHRPDGRRVYVRALAAPTINAEGRITYVTVSFTDIGREVQAETARATLETQLKLAIDHAPVALFSIDPEGTITLSEGAGLAAMGVRAGQLVGESVFDLYREHPSICGAVRSGLAGESGWYTVQLGSAIYDTWLMPQRDRDGAVIAVIGVATDVSELRQLQAVAIQHDRVAAMGTLAASVAHEINNPLTYVLASLDMLGLALRNRGADDDNNSAIELISTARTGVDRIASITRDLRTFSRPDDDSCDPVRLGDVVERLLRLSGKEIEARATLELALGDTPPIHVNEARLTQVVMNLMNNALHAVKGRTPACVTLTTRTADGNAVLEVSDNGPGIDPELRARVFDPFVTTKAVGQGTGLGLFVCRNLVQEVGGQITVGERPGGGAMFQVVLPPASRRAAGKPASDVSVPTSASGARVLVIDDEPLIGAALAKTLCLEGFRAEMLASSEQGLTVLLADRTYDLVLCDLMMPGLTGMDLAARLAQHAPELLDRVVFMTGGAFTPAAARFLESRAGRHLVKPFDVVTEVRRLLGQPK